MSKKGLVAIFAVFVAILGATFAGEGPSRDTGGVRGKNDMKPMMLIELFKSGARAPFSKPFGSEEWIDYLGLAKMSATGEKQHYLLGREISRLYPSIFEQHRPLASAEDTPSKYYEMFAVQFSRTVHSAYAHLYGLFDLNNGNKLNPKFHQNFPQFTQGVIYSKFDEGPVQLSKEFSLTKGLSNIPVQLIDSETINLTMTNFEKMCPKAHSMVMDHHHHNIEKHNNFSPLVQQVSLDLEKRNFRSNSLYSTPYWDLNSITDFYDYLKSYQFYYGNFLHGTDKKLLEKMNSIANLNTISKKWPHKYQVKLWTTKFMKMNLSI
jgi:hypothetical protein